MSLFGRRSGAVRHEVKHAGNHRLMAMAPRPARDEAMERMKLPQDTDPERIKSGRRCVAE